MTNSPPPRSKPKRLTVRRIVAIVLALPFAVLLGWILYINRPRPNFDISELPAAGMAGRDGTDSGDLAEGDAFDTDGESRETGNDTTAEEAAEQAAPAEFHVSVVYSPGYLIDLGGLEKLHPFDIRKYEKIHKALKADELLTDEQTFRPAPIERDDMLLVHTEAYLESLQNRVKLAEYLEARELILAPVSLDTAVLAPFRRASGGTLMAARLALQSGVGVNIGGGYHHAKPTKGEGFCVYADVPIAIRRLQEEGAIKRAVIVDVDVHQGNGTIVCLANDDTTYTFSMHQRGIYPMPKEIGDRDVELPSGMGDDEYMATLDEHLAEALDAADADICFIVGGCDPLAGDPLASLEMTPEGIVRRDHAIIEACRQRNLPVVLTLSGGYSPNAWRSQYMSIANLISTYGLSEAAPQSDNAESTTEGQQKTGGAGFKPATSR